MIHPHFILRTVLAIGLAAFGTQQLSAEDAKDQSFAIASGKLTLSAPKGWARKQPASRIVEHEFAAPKVDTDEIDGRFTVMAAGGSVAANIDRWVGQFAQPDGGSTKEKTKTQELMIAKNKVHVVDISGNYKDQARGPMGPAVTREGFRMLAAIIETEKDGLVFLKFYGPKKTVDMNEKPFMEMLQTLKAK